MTVGDREINVRIEQQLTRLGINTQKLTISAHQGEVLIQGELEKRSVREKPMSGTDMKMIDRKLQRVRDVKRIQWNLTNWERRGMQWLARRKPKTRVEEGAAAPEGGGTSPRP